MSSGLFQNLPGAHEMAGSHALPSEPWLLPISDRRDRISDDEGSLPDDVHAAGRSARIVVATFLLLWAAQIIPDWMGSGPSQQAKHQLDEASPLSAPVMKAAFTSN